MGWGRSCLGYKKCTGVLGETSGGVGVGVDKGWIRKCEEKPFGAQVKMVVSKRGGTHRRQEEG